MNNINDIFKLLKEAPNKEEKQLLEKAYLVAQKAHETQTRSSGEPYFNHVFETAKNLARFGLDSTTVAAGFLHDTIEDTEVTEEEIKKDFGDEIVFLVNGVTKLGTLRYQGRERHMESLRKFFIATAQDFRVVAIKLCDRLHNVKTLEHIRPEKQKRIALETLEIYGPLAYRLGMGKLAGQLQDLAFPFAYSKEAKMVADLLKQKKKVDEKYMERVWRILKTELATNNINHHEIHSRVKGNYSLWGKLQRKKMDIEKIYDIVALRVIVPKIEDCYRVLGIIHSKWRPLPGRIKDYIALPKTNGYQSIHTTIFTGDGGITEIQIRTQEMHEYAEYGLAAHHLYKKNYNNKAAWIQDLKEIQSNEKNEVQFINNLKTDFCKDRIFVFTPLGDVVDLPKEASAIDFAYTIHSEIGNTAQAAKINGKHSALKTILQNGDIIEITTNKKSSPSRKWLDFAKTTIARKHIQQATKDDGILKRFFK